jgi:hypothetical protein
VQQLGSGQNMQSQLANQGAYGQMQGLGMQQNLANNAQNMQNAQLAAQYGLAGQQAGEQSRQFGSNLGLQGLQQQLAASGQLGALGQQQYNQMMGINAAQQAAGGQQQTAEQNKINQAIQNYATQQQYPMMQLGMMSNMLRGLPMQSTTTQSYQAMPSTAQQLIGAAGTLGSTYQAFNPTPKKEGGVIKGLAHGGSINNYAVGGEVKQQLSMMSDEQLQRIVQTSPSNEIRSMAGQILAEHKMAEQMTKNPEAGQGLMAANTGNTFENMAGGGIIAFAGGGKPDPIDDARPLTDEELAARMEAPVAPGLPATPVQKPAQIGGLDFGSNLRGIEQDRVSRGIGAPRQAEKEMVEKRLAGLDAQEYTQNKLAQAQFFARLGTTPGGVLRGGLKAAEETMPELAKLRADQTKIRDNYTNIQANIAEADRLDKLGMFDKAEAIREKSVKEAGENSRAKDANDRALESARITAAASIKGHQIAADASLRAAAIRTAREKIDERAYNAIIQTVAQELKLPPNDPKVLEEAFLRFSGAKGLAGPKLSDTTSTQINAEITRATDKDPVLEDLKLQKLRAPTTKKEGDTKLSKVEVQAKIDERMKAIADNIKDTYTRKSNAKPASPVGKEPGIGGDKPTPPTNRALVPNANGTFNYVPPGG